MSANILVNSSQGIEIKIRYKGDVTEHTIKAVVEYKSQSLPSLKRSETPFSIYPITVLLCKDDLTQSITTEDEIYLDDVSGKARWMRVQKILQKGFRDFIIVGF